MSRTVLAWIRVVVAVCIQTAVSLEAKPGNESTANFVTNVTETSPLVIWKSYRQDLDPGWVQIVLCCDGNIAPVSYYNSSLSTFVRCPGCEVDAPDDAPFCIKTYFNSTGDGMQSFIVPAEGKVKIGTKEIDVESITQLYGPNPEPVTDPPPSVSDSTGTAVAATVAGALLAIIACIVLPLLTSCICCWQKARRRQRDIETLRDTIARGGIPAARPSLQQIGVDPPEPTDDPPEPTDDPPLADVLPARKTPNPGLKRGPLESPPSQTSSKPAIPALHATHNKEMPTWEPENPRAPQASRVGEDPNQKDTTEIV